MYKLPTTVCMHYVHSLYCNVHVHVQHYLLQYACIMYIPYIVMYMYMYNYLLQYACIMYIHYIAMYTTTVCMHYVYSLHCNVHVHVQHYLRIHYVHSLHCNVHVHVQHYLLQYACIMYIHYIVMYMYMYNTTYYSMHALCIFTTL